MKFESRVAELFEPHRPEWSVQVISGGYWKHFAQGDRVLVFGEPDPANGSRRVRRGIVIDPPTLDIVRIDFGGEGHGEFSPADPVRVSYLSGTCPCVVVIS